MKPEDKAIAQTLTPLGRRCMEALLKAGSRGRRFPLEDVIERMEQSGGAPSRTHALRLVRDVAVRLRIARRPFPSRVTRLGRSGKAEFQFVEE